jgi:hypothetical protein
VATSFFTYNYCSFDLQKNITPFTIVQGTKNGAEPRNYSAANPSATDAMKVAVNLNDPTPDVGLFVPLPVGASVVGGPVASADGATEGGEV